ncbi:MAG TPA: RDD family protein [Candidatus Dormibacteraeota bacterium]|nr:RDD family protein [Candidatus Dormibacteraeota bacterium]
MASPDKLTIETPEQTSLEFSLAGIGSRFLALATDTAIQIVFLLVLVTAAFSLIPVARLAGMLSLWAIAGLIIGAFLIYEGYFAFFEAVWNGQTPGKRLAGLRVIKDDGRPIGVYDAVARNLMRIVDQMPGIYAVGIVVMLFSKQSKRLGDHVAGTVVVHEKTLEGARPFSGASSESVPRVLDTSRISLDEFRLVETFLHRRDSIGPDARRRMAAGIVRRLAPKAGLSPQPWPESERFIETLYEQVRAQGLRQ